MREMIKHFVAHTHEVCRDGLSFIFGVVGIASLVFVASALIHR